MTVAWLTGLQLSAFTCGGLAASLQPGWGGFAVGHRAASLKQSGGLSGFLETAVAKIFISCFSLQPSFPEHTMPAPLSKPEV